MKGICHIWSRGRHFSPSMPGDRYLKLSSQKRSPGRNLGEHHLIRRSGTASRGTALLVFCLRMRSFPVIVSLTIFVAKSKRVGPTKYKPTLTVFARVSLLHKILKILILKFQNSFSQHFSRSSFCRHVIYINDFLADFLVSFAITQRVPVDNCGKRCVTTHVTHKENNREITK